MPEPEGLTLALQESIIAALVYDDRWGALIANQLKADHFDPPLNEIAGAVLEYRATYRKPPGDVHLADLFGAQLERGVRPSRVSQLLHDIAGMRDSLNGEYVANQVTSWVRCQLLKAAILQAGARYEQGGPELVPQVEEILAAVLVDRAAPQMTAGTFLDRPEALGFLTRREVSGYPLGIPPLDALGVALIPKELILCIAPKGVGKTWFCVHCGKQVARRGGRFLHISLEMREEVVAGRYFQSWFGASQRDEEFRNTIVRLDSTGNLKKLLNIKRKAPIHFTHPHIQKELRRRQRDHGTELGNILVKEFPNGWLSSARLSAYLDRLEKHERYTPAVLAIDYPDLMKFDRRDYRIGVRGVFEDIRQLAVERNIAVVVPTQSSRKGMDAKQVTANMVAEDISKVQTADVVLTVSATREERERGLARLHLEHSRNTPDGRSFLLTQSYPTGQFCRAAYRQPQNYYQQMQIVEEAAEEIPA